MTGSHLEPIAAAEEGFVIRGSLERLGLFNQERQINYVPGESLLIADKVSAPGLRLWPHVYVSSLHLAPDLEPVMRTDGFTIELGPNVVDARMLDDDCTVTATRGQENPLLGWYSTGYLRMEPTTAVRALCRGRSREIVWDISFR